MDKLTININNDYISETGNEYSEYSHCDIISALKFIGKVKKNEKISTVRMTVQDNDSWYTSFIRTITTQNRHKTMVFLQNVIGRAFEIASIYIHDTDKHKNRTGWFIIDDIKKSLAGIHNITNTYRDDRMFVCKMESLLQSIGVRLGNFHNTRNIEEMNYSSNIDIPIKNVEIKSMSV